MTCTVHCDTIYSTWGFMYMFNTISILHVVSLAALLSREEKEHLQVEHNIASLQKDMVRLSTLITEKRGEQEKLEQGNILTENDFIYALKVSSDMADLGDVEST